MDTILTQEEARYVALRCGVVGQCMKGRATDLCAHDLFDSHEALRAERDRLLLTSGNTTLQEAIQVLATALASMPARLDSVDNGYCTLCGRHRLSKSGIPQKCENPRCWSHHKRYALAHPAVVAAMKAIKVLGVKRGHQ